MNEPYDLQQISYKSERAESRRLALADGLTDEQALRRTLERKAGKAGLAALVAARTAGRAARRPCNDQAPARCRRFFVMLAG